MKNWILPFSIFVLLTFITAIQGHAQISASFPAEKDATIFSEQDNGSNGSGDLFVGRTNQPANRRTLIKFDLSSIPSNATVTEAVLMIRGSKQSTSAVAIHRLTADWGEGDTEGSGQGGGQPSSAQTGDATWSHSFFNTSPWDNPGGDFVSSSSASTGISQNATSSWTGNSVIEDVQGWISNPENNFGWILIGQENQNNSAVRMVSSEGSSNAPMLLMFYEVEAGCTADGGTLNGGPYSFCVGDGTPDFIMTDDLTLSGNSGQNSQRVITDEQGNILGLPDAFEDVDFEDAGTGTCLLSHLSYEDGLTGLELGGNINNIEGCFDFSNVIEVVRTGVNGGTIELVGEEEPIINICRRDGVADPLSGDVTLTGNEGPNGAWIFTDLFNNTIFSVTDEVPTEFSSFEGFLGRLQFISYDNGLTGLTPGESLDDLSGCFELSNAIIVSINEVTGGELQILSTFGTEITVCAGDGVPDPVEVIGFGTGLVSQYIVTDILGTILDFQKGRNFNFEEAGEGVCQIYAMTVSIDTVVAGLEVGANISDLSGCFALSTPVTITRVVSGDLCAEQCDVNGGELSLDGGGTDLTICIGNGISDAFNVNLDAAVGTNMAWVITDEQGIIVGLPVSPPFDLEDAGIGVCQVWNLSYEDGATGLEIGENIAQLGGCFSLSSNAITVTRVASGDICDEQCDVAGGALEIDGGGIDITICASDGVSDAFSVTLDSASGLNMTFVITGSDGQILGLTSTPSFDLDQAGPGVCQIWNISYDESITGLEVLQNINNLSGCFDLSNPITVTRVEEGGPCEPECTAGGGELALEGGGTEITICADDGISDAFNPVLTGQLSDNSNGWVITDTDGNILGLPTGMSIDLEGSGEGVCLLRNINSSGELAGLEVGMNINDLVGCFDFSNVITITRNVDCAVVVEPLNFEAILTATQQTSPVLSGAKGNIQAILQGNSLSLTGSFEGLTGDFAANIAGGAHIHNGIAGRNGSIEFSLTTDTSEDLKSGSYSEDNNTFTLTDEQIDALLSREYYVNVHTDAFPGGEIRGQLLPASDNYFHTTLQGSNEVPSIVSRGLGSILFELEDTSLTVTGSFDGLSSLVATSIAGGSHIHQAMAGRNGGLTFPLNITFDDDTTGGVYEAVNNTFVLTQEQIDALIREGMYVNVHSENFPSGELRGQIAPVSCATFRADLAGTQQIPPVMSGADGRIILNYNANGTITASGTFNNLESDINVAAAGGMHIHGAPAGRSGGILFPLTFDLDDSNRSGTLLPQNNTFEITDEQLDMLFARGMYVNVHSVDNGSGEIRGQLLPVSKSYLGTSLNGMNGVPPVISPGGGNVLFEINDNNLIVSGGFSGMSGDFAANIAGGSHLHLSDATGTGGIGLSLNVSPDQDLKGGIFDPFDNTFVISDGLRDSLIQALLYVNIHTSEVPSGELRGQVLRDDNAFPDPSFSITNPEDGFLFEIDTSSADPLLTEWEATTDPNGDLLVYTWQLATDATFDGILINDKVGAELSATIGILDLDDMLATNGLDLGDTSIYFHRVLASDGSVSTPSAARTIQISRPAVDVCEVDGGTTTGGPFTFCVGDGIPDNIPDSEVSVSGNSGQNSRWVVTDETGTIILGLPENISDVDFDGAGPGICLIWNLSYDGEIEGLVVDAPVSGLMGCFDLSLDAVTVNRSEDESVCGPVCDVSGGSLTGGPFSFCVGDGFADNIADDAISLSGNSGQNSQWVITDENGNILGLPSETFSAVDFDGAGTGTCLVWHLSYDDGLVGLELGSNVDGLEGCFSFSNSVTVIRTMDASVCGSCDVTGSLLTGGPFIFCVGDGSADNIPSDGIGIFNNNGPNSSWVVTDIHRNILGLPPTFDAVDFDGAGTGVCQVWLVSYDGVVTGLELGLNLDNIQGCYGLSNPVAVERRNDDVTCDRPVCEVSGGMLEGGPFTFCVGDGAGDHIPGSEVQLTGNSGPFSQLVVTDQSGTTILGLPQNISDVDFDGAGPGVCLVWNLTYDGDLEGLTVNGPVSGISGCFDFSSTFVTVNRSEDESVCGPSCDVSGGSLTGGPFTFCVGDGTGDHIPDGDVQLTGNSGTNSQFVVTDQTGTTILGLPQNISDVDFDGAGPGVCLVWNLSYDGELEGLTVNGPVSGISGCYELSSTYVTVNRSTDESVCGSECLVEGGSIESTTGLTSFTFCVGDGIPNPFDVNVEGSSIQSKLIITDDKGNILGIPESNRIDLEGAGLGVCQVWNIAYDGSASGIEVGGTISEISGCYDLSNPITVTRIDCPPNDCQTPLNLRIIQKSSRSFELRWDRGGSNVKGYEVMIGIEDQPGSFVVIPVRRNRISVSTVSTGTIVVKVRSICRFGMISEYTETLTFSQDPSKSRSDITNKSGAQYGEFFVYDRSIIVRPNPAINYIEVAQSDGTFIDQIDIFDVNGKRVLSQPASEEKGIHRFNISELPSGIYLIKVNSDSGIIELKRFIKTQ